MICIWHPCLPRHISWKPKRGGGKVNVNTDVCQGKEITKIHIHIFDPAVPVSFSLALVPSCSVFFFFLPLSPYVLFDK